MQEERYLGALGLGPQPLEPWHNTSLPVLVTYASGDSHAQAVGFVRAVNAKLPYTVLLYNLGLSPNSLVVVSIHTHPSLYTHTLEHTGTWGRMLEHINTLISNCLQILQYNGLLDQLTPKNLDFISYY